MSPICTHLGCIAGNAEQEIKEERVAFYWPCHGGKYDKIGMNIGASPLQGIGYF